MKYREFSREAKKKIDSIDDKVDEKFEDWQSPLLLEFFEGMTSLGSPFITMLIIGFLVKIGEFAVAKNIIVGLFAAGVSVGGIKKITKRTRPSKHQDKVFSEKSFPSGHSTTAFMVATILTASYNNSSIFFSLATTVAISRVILEDHYFSDVLTGSIIGLMIGITIATL